MMKKILLALLVLMTAPFAAGSAGAGSPISVFGNSSAGLIGSLDGMAQVDIVYVAPSSCHYIASAEQIAPAGERIPDHTLPLTVVVATRSGPCVRQRTRLRDVHVVNPDLNTNLVRIFFVTPSGKRLKTEQIAIVGL
jgi:hypothetical protein